MSHDSASVTERQLEPPAQEHRAFLRYPSDRDGKCQAIEARPGDPWLATVRDVSAGGLGVQTSRGFKEGTILVIELLDAAENAPHQLLARVKRAVSQEDGSWSLGCELLSPPSSERLDELRQDRGRK